MERVIIFGVETCPVSVRQKKKTHAVPEIFRRRLRGFRLGPKANLRRISEALQKVDPPAQRPWCRNNGDRLVRRRGW
jgi:hypothetical protein